MLLSPRGVSEIVFLLFFSRNFFFAFPQGPIIYIRSVRRVAYQLWIHPRIPDGRKGDTSNIDRVMKISSGCSYQGIYDQH